MSGPETSAFDLNGLPTRVRRGGGGPPLGFLAGFGGLCEMRASAGAARLVGLGRPNEVARAVLDWMN